ncbi:MAG: zinc-dependent peptidase [Arenicella sp.]
MSLLKRIKRLFTHFLCKEGEVEQICPLDDSSREFLLAQVAFYANLEESDRGLFERRVLLFLQTTEIVGHDVVVTQQDRLLVASAAIILVWKFPDWHYLNLDTVSLVSASFNEQADFGQADSNIQGLVGTGTMRGKMILSKPALHYGFSNNRDKQNVALHEFAHLLDMADGDCDGFPERMSEYGFARPWFDLMHQEISVINQKNSNIRAYGGTSQIEFFAVASEYFFERPGLLCRKHPQVYAALKAFYRQDVTTISQAVQPRKKDPCPCGSGKRYKRCCLP